MLQALACYWATRLQSVPGAAWHCYNERDAKDFPFLNVQLLADF